MICVFLLLNIVTAEQLPCSVVQETESKVGFRNITLKNQNYPVKEEFVITEELETNLDCGKSRRI